MDNDATEREITAIKNCWKQDRWKGITRPYTAERVYELAGSMKVDYPIARMAAEKLWFLLNNKPFVRTFGALTGLQTVQMVKAGLEAIYVSGWQVAADANTAGETYPDQSLYPANSVPLLVRRINNALKRERQKQKWKGKRDVDWLIAPIVADAEAGFGGNLNAEELMRAMIHEGAAGVHFEDQDSRVKKCGHLGGKILVPVKEFVEKLIVARLTADLMGVPTVLIARTDAEKAIAITGDYDERDRPFLSGKKCEYCSCFASQRSSDNQYHEFNGGTKAAIARGLEYAPYADMLWMETEKPDLEQAREFAEAIHAKYPGKLLAYNCSPSFNWGSYFAKLILKTIERYKQEMPEQPSVRATALAIAELVSLDMSEADIKHCAEAIENCKMTADYIVKSAIMAPLLENLLSKFQIELGKLGYKFQFITLLSFHLILYHTFMIALDYAKNGMAAFSRLQRAEFDAETQHGFDAVKHQEFVGTSYFDEIMKTVTSGRVSTLAMKGSTEEEQFK